ncbi:MAG: hypothetical protein JST88_03975 [Bacteroidetes bacterium]|nr:hypothetical protein [Bacteroidota bacterium]
MKSFSIFLFASTILVSLYGCQFDDHTNTLKIKEAELNKREQQIILRERDVLAREEKLKTWEREVDSTQLINHAINMDTELLVGVWSVKMLCIETSCLGSAIGDVKSERWTISYQNGEVLAEAYAQKKLIRVYKGAFLNGVLKLSDYREDSGTQIDVELTMDGKISSKMKGTRIIQQPSCKIVYNLEMERLRV